VTRGRVLTAVVVVAALAAAVVGVGVWRGWFADPSVSGAPDGTAGAVSDVATDLRAPWGLAFLPDGSALVTERDSARVLSVPAGGGAASEVTVVAEAAPSGEGGLLGIAYADEWVYVYYTAAEDNRIARFRLASPASPEVIFDGIPKAGNHNGGRIAFGPDGFLYVGTGDAAERGASQDRSSLAGKILRLTPTGSPAPGNPFGDSPVYTLGHRNVQGLAWDAGGRMYAAEFGQNRYDELNRIMTVQARASSTARSRTA
jgi:glucose/arabinose dehydrogenase